MLFLRGEAVSCVVITLFIGLISYVGDCLLYSVNNSALRAVSDNLTHAFVGGLSWSLIIKLSSKPISRNVFGITACFLISSLIDLDHFLLAKSWRLRDAQHLGSQRPILHSSLIPLLIWLVFEITYKIFRLHSTVGYYCWVIVTAFVTHHLRDANRRGLWFGFFGSTPPVPYYLYLFIAMVLPYFIYWLMPDDVIRDGQVLTMIQTVQNNCLSIHDV